MHWSIFTCGVKPWKMVCHENYVKVHVLSISLLFSNSVFPKNDPRGSKFSLSWLSSEDDDEWLTSSPESEFMKDFNANEGCMNGNVLSCYDIKTYNSNHVLSLFQCSDNMAMSLADMIVKVKLKTDLATILLKIEKGEASTPYISM